MSSFWTPLESNPDVLNQLIEGLDEPGGLLPSIVQCCDVFGLDPELLLMLPQPVYAMILLFPVTDTYERFRKEEQTRLEKEPDHAPSSLYFMHQKVGNACGTIALMHSLLNAPIPSLGNGTLSRFHHETRDKTPAERAIALENFEGVRKAHEDIAAMGQTEAPEADADMDLHFVCFTMKEGHLWELDGRKSRPIDHGPCTEDTFLNSAAKVVQQFMDRDPENLQFTMIALTAAT